MTPTPINGPPLDEAALRAWVRENYTLGAPIDPTWPAAMLDEIAKIDATIPARDRFTTALAQTVTDAATHERLYRLFLLAELQSQISARADLLSRTPDPHNLPHVAAALNQVAQEAYDQLNDPTVTVEESD